MANVDKEALALHKTHRGKLEVKSKVPLQSAYDLTLAYTPGVAAPCLEIKDDFDKHIKEKWGKDKSSIKASLLDYDKNMLVYLNEYLVAKEIARDNKTDLSFNIGAKLDIEHIMPYSGKNLSQIRTDANISDGEEFKSMVNKLGNKILLEEKINRTIGNEWFRTKVTTDVKDRIGYKDSCYPIARLLVEQYQNSMKPYWTKEDIIKATEKASERILNFIFN